MDRLTIIWPIVVKVRVTEEYKKRLSAEIQQAVRQLDLQMQHFEFRARRLVAELEKQNPQGIPAARQQLEQERGRLLEARQKLVERLKEVGRLSPGEEVIHGQVQALMELRVGDCWQDLSGWEIVLEDNVVREIRRAERDASGG